MKGHAIRSRTRWIENGEKPLSIFVIWKKHNYLNKTIKKLEVDRNRMISDQVEILNEVKCVYENIYANKDSELLNLDFNIFIKKTFQNWTNILQNP
jgi:hypothetical protein